MGFTSFFCTEAPPPRHAGARLPPPLEGTEKVPIFKD